MSYRTLYFRNENGNKLNRYFIFETVAEMLDSTLIIGDLAYTIDNDSFYIADSDTTWSEVAGGAGAVASVNGQTGVVVLDTGDISEAANLNYVSDAQLVVIGNTSGTNTGDQTNITGNAATVTTNANLTGHVTSVGNAAVLGSFTSAQLKAAVSDETGSGVAVFADGPTMTLPAISGTAAAAGVIGYDATQKMQTTYGGATASEARIHTTISAGVGTETLTNSTAADQDYTAAYTFPANSIYTNKVYRVSFFVEVVGTAAAITLTPYLKIGTTKVYLTGTVDPAAITRSVIHTFYIFGRDAAGAAANVSTTALPVTFAGVLLNGNQINQPVALATNGTLTINLGVTFSGIGSTETMEQQAFIIEELN